MGKILNLYRSNIPMLIGWDKGTLNVGEKKLYSSYDEVYKVLSNIVQTLLYVDKRIIFSHISLYEEYKNRYKAVVYLYDSEFYIITSVYNRNLLKKFNFDNKLNLLSSLYKKLVEIDVNFIKYFYTNSLYDLKVNYVLMKNKSVNSKFILEYMKHQLKKGFFIRNIFTTISRILKKVVQKGYISGYKIVCKGRPYKRSRSVVVKYSVGDCILKPGVELTHSSSIVVLKYGVCCINIWFYSHTNIHIIDRVVSLE